MHQIISHQTGDAKVATPPVRAIIGQTVKRPYVLAALTLYWLWVNMAIQSPLFFPQVATPWGMAMPSWFGAVAASAVSYFVLGSGFRRATIIARRSWYGVATAAVMMAGAILCLVWIELLGAHVDAAGPLVVLAAGSICMGVGTSCQLIEWGRVFGFLGPREVLYHGIIAMTLSAAALAALSFAPALVARLVFVFIPVPLALCFARVIKPLPKKAMYEQGLDAELHVPWKFLVTALLHGLALGVLLGGFLAGQTFHSTLMSSMGFLVAAFILLLTSIFVKMDFNHLIYQIGFPLMACGAVVVACFGTGAQWGMFIQLVGFCYVHLIMWGLCSYLTKRFSLSAAWVVAWPTCCLMMGQLAGGVMASVLANGAIQSNAMQTLETVVSFVVLLAALLMLSNRNLTTGWGIAIPANNIDAAAVIDPTEQAIRAIAVEVGMTPRETDVFAFVARGYNRKSISEELMISEETAKSHTNGIYRKMGVHSQQELLASVKKCEEELGLHDRIILE